jgi:hypothetical protein
LFTLFPARDIQNGITGPAKQPGFGRFFAIPAPPRRKGLMKI